MALLNNSQRGKNKSKEKPQKKNKPKSKYSKYGTRTFGNTTIKVKDPTEYGHFYKKSGYNQPTKKRPNYSVAHRRRTAINEFLVISAIVIVVLIVSIVLIDIALKFLNREQPQTNETNIVSEPEEIILDDGIVDLELPEKQIFGDPAINNIDSNATSIFIEWEDTTDVDYIVSYRVVQDGINESHGTSQNHDMSTICTAYYEGTDSGNGENVGNGWLYQITSESTIEISGLSPSTTYDIHIRYADESLEEYLPSFQAKTLSTGYGDPFKAVYSILNVPSRDENTGAVLADGEYSCVRMTSESGIIGAEAKPMMNISLYSDPTDSNASVIESEAAGTSLFISADPDGNCCYHTDNDGWYVFVQSESGTRGWVNARTLLIDVASIFESSSNIYGIQINRTNAYSSIFTSGGDAHAVNNYSEADTRYDAVSGNDAPMFLNTEGYNVIDNITGLKLANYGSEKQMPVIWDLALELKQCQKNALENGFTLLMYEGYRPLSTSAAVSSNLSNQGYLSKNVYGTDLAKGFLTDQAYNVSYYIAQKSRHNRGIATDLTLVRFSDTTSLGSEEIMQTKMHTLDYRCNMSYNNWQADLLSDIMIGHGSHLEYLSVKSEWWHFQLKTDRVDLYPMIDQYGYVDFVF